MKNLTSLLIFLFCSVNLAFANGDEPSNKSNSDSSAMRKSSNIILEQVMAYPVNIRSANSKEIVLLAFNVEPCGSIEILESNSSNPEFLEYVIDKIRNSEARYELSGEVQYLKCVFIKE